MGSSYRLFRVFGISVELHATFVLFLIFLALAPLFGFESSLGFVVLAFFFIVLHELSHSVVAKLSGVRVEKITLTPIGGIASVEIPDKPWLELGMSVAGPLLNFAVVGVCLLLIHYSGVGFVDYANLISEGAVQHDATYLLFLVLYINLVLGLFNVIPGFPMDGGRILRSFLALWMEYGRATEIAVGVGKYLVFPIMFVIGVLSMNISLTLIAGLLYLAGGQELKLVRLRRAFHGVRVGEVMAPKPQPVAASTTVLSFVSDPVNLTLQYRVLSAEGGRVVGVFDLSSLTEIDAGSANRTLEEFASVDYGIVSAEDLVNNQFRTLFGKRFVLVVSGNKVVGQVTPEILLSRMPLLSLKRKPGVAF
jgi:Zn-dependent protease